jgi:putative transposase
MARRERSAVGGEIYHVMNRGNCRMTLFGKPDDYLAFMRVMEEGRKRTGMRILA